MTIASETNPLAQLEALDRVASRPVEWLWQGHLAVGKLALLDGDPREGKSLLTLDLCARFTTGRPLPDGTPGPAACNCLLLQSEDALEDTVIPRLAALGADLSHVFHWRLRNVLDRPLLLPIDAGVLESAIQHCQARMLVIDPVMAFFDSSVFSSSDQSVRRALGPLAEGLERTRCSSILVRHLNKQRGFRALYRGGGSIGIQAACRTSWLVGSDPDHHGRRILAQNKNNLAPLQPSLAYEVRSGAAGLPEIHWLGPCDWTADRVLAAAAVSTLQLSIARDFLTAFLASGPRLSHEVWAAAQKHDLAEKTLRRAAKRVPVVFHRVYKDNVRRTYWALEGQALPAELGAPKEPTEFELFLKEQEEKFPSPCPLDD